MSKKHQAFTLLEVMITIALLSTLVIASSSVLKSGFDLRMALSEKGRSTQRMVRVMDRISYDLKHSFLIPATDDDLIAGNPNRSIFRITKKGDSDELALTTFANREKKANAKTSDYSYVYYKVEKDEKTPGISHLFRGELTVFQEDFKEEPKMKIIATNIKSIKLDAWRGDQWMSREEWDSTRRDGRDRLPKMVRLTVEAWDFEEIDEEKPVEDMPVETYQTVVFINQATRFDDLKQAANSVNWNSYFDM